MAGITIELNGVKQINKAISQIDLETRRAIAAATNRTAAFIKTKLTESIREQYTVKAEDVKSRMNTDNKATATKLFALIKIKGSPMSIYKYFKVTPKFRYRKNRAYKIKTTIKKGQTKVISGPAFLPTSTSTKLQVWMRKTKARKPVVPLYTLSVAQMVNETVRGDIQELAQKELDKRIEHELGYRLDKLAEKYGKA